MWRLGICWWNSQDGGGPECLSVLLTFIAAANTLNMGLPPLRGKACCGNRVALSTKLDWLWTKGQHHKERLCQWTFKICVLWQTKWGIQSRCGTTAAVDEGLAAPLLAVGQHYNWGTEIIVFSFTLYGSREVVVGEYMLTTWTRGRVQSYPWMRLIAGP